MRPQSKYNCQGANGQRPTAKHRELHMSIKGLLQPVFSTFLTDQERLRRRQERLEKRRQRRGLPHTVTWFHRADDPYSHLLAQVLPTFAESFDVALECRTVSNPPAHLVPFPEELAVYALRDCAELAAYYGLQMKGDRPTEVAVDAAHTWLVKAERSADYLDTAKQVGLALWGGEVPEGDGEVTNELEKNRRRLHRLGHYSSGMLHYGGEWYWGVDRLPLLERRLEELGAGGGQTLRNDGPVSKPDDRSVLDVYLSVRSPYSYLAVDRVLELRRQCDAEVRLKPILPMVMRGLPVPFAKRRYIVADSAREAAENGIPFGRICDPLGRGVERVLAVLVPLLGTEREGDFLTSAMRGIWSEGIEVASDRGLRLVVERAGLDWGEAKQWLEDESWRDVVEQNRLELRGLGLWGVPSFKLGNFVTWGQDRIWLVKQKLAA